MQEYLGVTPCLLNKKQQQDDTLSWQNPSKHEYLTSTFEKPTKSVNFTTELQVAFRQVAPRLEKATTRMDGPIQIYEDEEGNKALQSRTNPVGNRQGAGLGEKMNASRSGLVRTSLKSLNISDRDFRQTKSRNVGTENRGSRVQDRKGPLEKEARRKSIYMFTRDVANEIKHPEAVRDIRHPNGTRTCAEGSSRLTRGASSEKKRLGRDSLAVAPRRGILQPPPKVLQEQCSMTDRLGRRTGKENIPPGHRLSSVGKKSGKDGEGSKANARSSRHVTTGCCSAPGASNRIRNNRESDEAPNTKRPVSSSILDGAAREQGSYLKILLPKVNDRHSQCQKSKESCSRSKIVTASHLRRLFKPSFTIAIPRPTTYALLREDISQPQRYEEYWIKYQKTAMTELINTVVKNIHTLNTHRQADTSGLKHEMMEVCQSTSMPFLYKRLQASLQYGSLSRPRDTLCGFSRTLSDIGFRQQFVRLWTKTYCSRLLTAAVEVVTGRELTASARSATTLRPSQVTEGRASIHDLEVSIESCLLRNEDACEPAGYDSTDMNYHHKAEYLSPRSKSALWSWRRTSQRCLMIIVLIDNAKASGLLTKNISGKSSKQKLSYAVLGQLTALLMPWAGDVTRHLSHLDYNTSHVQHPFAECQFLVDSVAKDLRDGVQLTYLVGLLLYPPTQLTQPSRRITRSIPPGDVPTTNAMNRASRHS